MLFSPGLSSYGFQVDNWGTNPSAAPGTSITPGASNAEGSPFVEVIAGSALTEDCYWIFIKVYGGNTVSNAKNHLLDIGIDPAGGTSWTEVIANIVCGGTASLVQGGRDFLFPFRIAAGSSVAVRIQGSNATAGTVFVVAQLYGRPSHPETVPTGTFAHTFGTITNSSGPTVTPGNAADGTWVDLGQTGFTYWWFQLGYQIDNGTVTAENTYIELGYGNGSNKTTIMRLQHQGNTSEILVAPIQTNLIMPAAYHRVRTDVNNIYVRARCQNAPDTGYNVSVIAIGDAA